MVYTFLSCLIIISISVLLLGIKLFFSKEESFPETHIGNNKAMKKKGISCIKSQDLEERNKKNIFELSSFEK